MNFSDQLVNWHVPDPLLIKPTPVLNNETSLQYNTEASDIMLLPYQALIFELAP
jgi:hypothetical protein